MVYAKPMKQVILMLLAIITIAAAQTTPTNQTKPPPNTLGQTSPYAPYNITQLEFERTACERNCRAYKVTVRADGRFEYVGVNAVSKLGVHSGQVSVGQLRNILAYVDEIDFFDFPESSDAVIADLDTNPVSVVGVWRDGRVKRVVNPANGGSARLWALGQLVDALVASAVWDE